MMTIKRCWYSASPDNEILCLLSSFHAIVTVFHERNTKEIKAAVLLCTVSGDRNCQAVKNTQNHTEN